MTAVPSAQDVATRLGKAVEQVNDAYLAEVADQSSRCRVDPYTDALASALVRRVRRAMEMSNHPLGVQIDADGVAVRFGSNDPEVRRLEAPYRRLVCG